jgi:DNA-binding NtrC family response regulator
MSALSPSRVLLLDDDRITVDTLAVILNQNGYEARSVYNHRDAVATAREFCPDIFVTGFVNCCEKNGCETAIEILSLLPKCHVLIISGQAATADAVDEYRRIGYDFKAYAKPLHPQDFLHLLRGIPLATVRETSRGE